MDIVTIITTLAQIALVNAMIITELAKKSGPVLARPTGLVPPALQMEPPSLPEELRKN